MLYREGSFGSPFLWPQPYGRSLMAAALWPQPYGRSLMAAVFLWQRSGKRRHRIRCADLRFNNLDHITEGRTYFGQVREVTPAIPAHIRAAVLSAYQCPDIGLTGRTETHFNRINDIDRPFHESRCGRRNIDSGPIAKIIVFAHLFDFESIRHDL